MFALMRSLLLASLLMPMLAADPLTKDIAKYCIEQKPSSQIIYEDPSRDIKIPEGQRHCRAKITPLSSVMYVQVHLKDGSPDYDHPGNRLFLSMPFEHLHTGIYIDNALDDNYDVFRKKAFRKDRTFEEVMPRESTQELRKRYRSALEAIANMYKEKEN
jgi:hypothetical protein